HGQVLARMYFTADSRSNIGSMIATGGGLSASSPLRARQGPPTVRLMTAETIVAAEGSAQLSGAMRESRCQVLLLVRNTRPPSLRYMPAGGSSQSSGLST